MADGRIYDVEMIRDFLDHLAWCLRAELDTAKRPSQELIDQLKKYMQGYQTTLLVLTELRGADDLPTFEREHYRERFEEEHLRVRLSQLEALESLSGLFAEALHAAGYSLSTTPRRPIDLNFPEDWSLDRPVSEEL